MLTQLATTDASGGKRGFIRALRKVLAGPKRGRSRWREYFKGLNGSGADVAHGPMRGLLARVQQTRPLPR